MLTLPIKKQWYDMIRKGKKKEEYRAINDYYKTRFENAVCETRGKKCVVELILRNGYRGDSPAIKIKAFWKIGCGKKEWGAEQGQMYFVLEIFEIKELIK